ncbi:MAG: neutral zinc metallopeptidase, partial [Planctomycetales bacterium]|nr:neutral zinc metallopeptidase [Planctomycetales bacterium]
MRWQGQAGSDNVEDRRGMKGPVAVGGGGLLVVVLTVVFALLRGGDPQQALQQGVQQLQQQAAMQLQTEGEVDPENDEAYQFASVVLQYTEDVWGQLFPELVGSPYQEPTMVLFRGAVNSACGPASSAVGPFYCPADQKVYLDLAFFDELQDKFQAPGDFACAYVIAHEVGHHVQNLLGESDRVQRMRARVGEVEANRLSVRLELQADFLAGVWAHHAQRAMQILEEGDVEEAIQAAQAIGDDTLQRRSQGRIVPDAFTHGTSAQRIRWFSLGLKTGNFEELELLFQL